MPLLGNNAIVWETSSALHTEYGELLFSFMQWKLTGALVVKIRIEFKIPVPNHFH